MPSTGDVSSPSTATIALATAILCFATGYFLGSASSLNIFSSPSQPSQSSSKKPAQKQRKSWPNSYDVTIHPDSSDEELMARLGKPPKAEEVPDSEDEPSSSEDGEEDSEGQDLSIFPDNKEECKLVLVVRNDLGMGRGIDYPHPSSLLSPAHPSLLGKISAQCSHATLSNYISLQSSSPNSPNPLLSRWSRHGQPKIVLQTSSAEELQLLQATALSMGLCANIVHDAGRTQIAAGSATVLGVGPGPKGVVDAVTGGLKLL